MNSLHIYLIVFSEISQGSVGVQKDPKRRSPEKKILKRRNLRKRRKRRRNPKNLKRRNLRKRRRRRNQVSLGAVKNPQKK